jgi:putative tricarboxylic transport membrane protein
MSLTTKRVHRRVAMVAVASTALLTSACMSPDNGGGDAADYPDKTIELMVPAAAGGGWDATARNMQQVVQSEEIADANIEVFNLEGGGGATGLSQLISREEGDPYKLMIGGLVMIGALEAANSPVELSDAETIATLTSETEAFVVAADSEFETINDVLDAYKQDPSSVTFGGGSAGGSDQIVAGLTVEAAGGDPAELKYIGYSGGGEAIAGILSGDVEVGVSGLSEFESQVEGGAMRLLAISSDEERDVAGEPAPTLVDAGYDVDFVNWRAIFAPPGLSDEESQAVADFVDEIHSSPAWEEVLEQQGWADDYRTGDEAQEFVDSETERIAGVLEGLGL